MKQKPRHKLKPVWTCLIILVMIPVFLIAGIWIYLRLTYEDSPVGYWKTPEAQAGYEEAYGAAMAALPEPGEVYDVPTDFGTVRVYRWSPPQADDGAPVVLLPGRASGVPMWSVNLPGLIEARTVYAMDALGDAGLSVQTASVKDIHDQNLWLLRTFEALDIRKAHLVGHSYGGLTAAQFASEYPERVASLSLLEPVFVFQGVSFRFMVKIMAFFLPIPQRWKDAVLADIAGTDADEIDRDDPVTRMIAFGTEAYVSQLPFPPLVTDVQMQSWEFPVWVGLAGKSSFNNAADCKIRAETNVRTVEVKIWPEGTHSLPMEYPEAINELLLKFMREWDTEKQAPVLNLADLKRE